MGEVVITGLGALTPLGADVATTWSGLLEGRSGVRALRELWAGQLPARIAGRLSVDPAALLGRPMARRMDRCEQVAVLAARQAWADAGRPEVEPERLAVVIGTGLGGVTTLLDQDDVLEKSGVRRVSPHTLPMLMPNGPAAWVSIDLGAKAGAHAPASGFAAGAEAIALGADLIRLGRADVVVAGGAEACVHPLTMAAFAQAKALSTRNDQPETACRPFGADRDGFVLGEGAAAVVLERADFRDLRGTAKAGLAGHGISANAEHVTASQRDGQMRAMRAALREAGLTGRDIAHVQAHATATPEGDVVEAAAIAGAVGVHPAVTAIKSMTGHLCGAAGALGTVAAVLAMRDGLIPATRNLDRLDPRVELDVVASAPRRWRPGAALVNAFGFGGHNVCLALTPASRGSAR
ncbi:beta-ketoacyl-[acyl-carrier-protein] synthase family protein [Nonomuraea typhae]|uniref:beta-ketoacyl-[acyl-carrier-protein] synthase family protein n=1 Tax=Nonomuraea typhae TaxID=2603600 RepID=UPI0012F80A0D|nr:beta-ketoacyl-[acyl-carrier-protein] synthase family protein [Nonomuraea typhae]